MNRDPEKNGLLEICEELGIGFVPRGPIGMGYLTQSLDADTALDSKTDLRSSFDRFQPETIATNKPFVDQITRLAGKKNATTAQLSLAWLLAKSRSFRSQEPARSSISKRTSAPLLWIFRQET